MYHGQTDSDIPEPVEVKVAIVDAMAEIQSNDKLDCINNCSQLADHFINHVMQKYSDSDEVRFIFDRYDMPSSLKMATRTRRQGGQQPIAYHIADTINIAKVPMKTLLSHTNTKMELASYLSLKITNSPQTNGRRVVAAWEVSAKLLTKICPTLSVIKKKRMQNYYCML